MQMWRICWNYLKKEESNDASMIPSYVSVGIDSMPSNNFETISGVLCSLRDEIYCLRQELIDVRNERERDIKILEQSESIMADLHEIKVMCRTSQHTRPHVSKAQLGSDRTPHVSVDVSSANTPIVPSYRDIVTKISSSKPGSGSKNSSIGCKSSEQLVRKRNISGNVSSDHMNPMMNRKKMNIKKGTKIISNESTSNFCVSRPVNHVYIGGCSVNTSTDLILKYCTDQDIDVKDIAELNTRSNYSKSFRITIDASHTDVVMKEDFGLKA